MKILSQTILSIFFLVLIAPDMSAQDCLIESDPFTNEKVVKYDFMRETIVYEHKNDKTFIKVKLNLDGEINTAFEAGTPFLLKTDEEKIIKLTTSEKSIPVSQVSGSRVVSAVVFVCELNDQALVDLEESRVTLIRHPDGKGSQYDLPIKKKFGKGFQDGAACMLNSI